jgi:hypothetical protein
VRGGHGVGAALAADRVDCLSSFCHTSTTEVFEPRRCGR